MSDINKAESSFDLRISGRADDEDWITILVNGQQMKVRQGESLAVALWAEDRRIFRYTDKIASPRGIFCGMGECFDCLVTIDGKPKQRACLTQVKPDMQVELGESWPK